MCPRTTACRLPAVLSLWLILLCAKPLPGQQIVLPRPKGSSLQLTTDQERMLARAREILKQAARSEAEREVRLQILKAALTGTAIRPSDDYPEMRNPRHWTLSDDAFVVAAESTPVEAIADLWIVHENDGVPVPRIRCSKYSALILIQGYIQYFRATDNTAGLEALNRLIGRRIIPQGLPDGGDDLLWKRRFERGRLLPGDQAWFDNPYFERGRELIREEKYQRAIREGKSPEAAAASADSAAESLTAGEEGSNVFYLGDDNFIRGASSLVRLCRDSFDRGESENAPAHEQVLTHHILTLAHFRQHMADDNYTAQACMRAIPGSVRLEEFEIGRVRSPIGPEILLRLYAGSEASKSLESLIDAMASRNEPPRLATVGDAAFPLFGDDYDWSEQRRVGAAMGAVMRADDDDAWWRLREKIRDDRYVLTATRGGVAKNFTVGALCRDMLDARLCFAFTSHLPLVPGRLPAAFRPEREFWRRESQWARERAPLYAMQAALCERAIELWEPIRGTLPGGDGQSHIYTADEKARFVAALKKEIAKLNETKKAASEEVVMHWLPAPSGWEGFDAQRAKEAREEYERKTAGAH
ncbi:MAG: hypothetical protein IT426_02585 [Pirellulales bacterium]|nr:hypothetical protein [Pirellulales bacterium]